MPEGKKTEIRDRRSEVGGREETEVRGRMSEADVRGFLHIIPLK